MSHSLSSRAERDLTEIWQYLVEKSGSIEVADDFLARIDKTFEKLSKNPRIGRPRPEFRPGLRSFPLANYLVFYRISGGDVFVSRVVHGRRDLPSVLAND